jgi:hypothetical protein
MMAQLQPLLEFDRNFILGEHQLHVEYCESQKGGEYKGTVRPWGMSKIYNSKKGFNRIGFSAYRTPANYFATDPNTGITDKSRKLIHTAETIHASVRIRHKLKGKGEDDHGDYDPTKSGAALAGFTLRGNPQEKNVRWEAGPERVLWEDEMGPMERLLLAQWHDIEKMVVSG